MAFDVVTVIPAEVVPPFSPRNSASPASPTLKTGSLRVSSADRSAVPHSGGAS